MKIRLADVVDATEVALRAGRLLAQSNDPRRRIAYQTADGYCSPAGSAGVDGWEILDELPAVEFEKGHLSIAVLLEHVHDVWVDRGKLSLAMDRMHHPSRLPPKLYKWLRENAARPIDAELFIEVLGKVKVYVKDG